MVSIVEGFIPVGWYPTAVAVSPDNETLFVANGKGLASRANYPAQLARPGTANSPEPYDLIGRTLEGFISVAPPENLYDFSFLAPCPSSGLIIHGDKDRVAPPASVQKLVDKLKTQKGITIEQQIMEGANHFFEGKIDELTERCAEYLDRRRADIAAGKGR